LLGCSNPFGNLQAARPSYIFVAGSPRSYADVGKPVRRFSLPKNGAAENKAFPSIFQYLRHENHFGIGIAIGSVAVLKTDTYESWKGEVAA
jgi:hypothetical protein